MGRLKTSSDVCLDAEGSFKKESYGALLALQSFCWLTSLSVWNDRQKTLTPGQEKETMPGCYRSELQEPESEPAPLILRLYFFPCKNLVGFEASAWIESWFMSHLRIRSDLCLHLESCISHVSQAGIALYFTQYSNKLNWVHINFMPGNSILRRGLPAKLAEMIAPKQRLTRVQQKLTK